MIKRVTIIVGTTFIIIAGMIMMKPIFDNSNLIVSKMLKQSGNFVGQVVNKYDEQGFRMPTSYYIEFDGEDGGKDRIRVSSTLYSKIRIGDKFETEGYIGKSKTYKRNYMSENDCKILDK